MRKLAALVGVLFLLTVATPVSAAFGEDDSLYAVLTYADRGYQVGSTVDLVVHVFEAGHYVSATEVTVQVGTDYINPHKVNVTEQGTGKYSGSFVIGQTDVTNISGSSWVTMMATVVKDGAVEGAYGTIDLEGATTEPLIVTPHLSPASAYGSPGETRTVTWEVRHKGALVDATEVALQVDGSDVTPPSKTSVGTYTYTYTFPTGTESRSIDLELTVKYRTTDGKDLEEEDSVQLYMNFMHVWAKRVGPITATGGVFEVYVSNRTGDPVSGATVNLNWSYEDDDDKYITKNLTARTDVNGMARVELAYNDLGLTKDHVELWGEVIGQGRTQDIGLDLTVRSLQDVPEAPDEDGFDMVPSKDHWFAFDKPATFSGKAYFSASPMSSQKVFYYLVTPHAVIALGNVTTQATGAMSIAFTTPNKGSEDLVMLEGHFEVPVVEVPDTKYYSDEEYMIVSSIDYSAITEPESVAAIITYYKDTDVKVSVDKIKKGEPVGVTLSYADATPVWEGMLLMGSDANPTSMGLVPEWTYWTESVMSGVYADRCDFSDGKFHGSVFIPKNLPDKPFFIVGGVINTDAMDITSITDIRDYIKTNYRDGLEVGKSSGTGDEDDGAGGLMDTEVLGLPLLYLIILIVVLAIAGGVAGYMVSRSKRAKAPTEAAEGPEKDEGPRFDSGPGPAAPMPMPSYQQPAGYGAPEGYQQPPAQYQQPEYAQPEYAQPEYAQPEYAQPEYAQPEYAQPEYAQPEYAQAQYQQPVEQQYQPPPPPQPQPQPQYAAAAPPPPQPAYQPPPPTPAQQPAAPAPAPAPPAPAPPRPAPPPAAPAPAPPAPAPPRPAAPPAPAPPAAPAAAAAAAQGMMTIKCQKCGTKLSIPRKRPIKVTCPTCGASGVLK